MGIEELDAIEEGIGAVDFAIARVCGFEVITTHKAGDPLTPGGFDALVIGMARELVGVAAPTEKRAIKAFLRTVDVDFATMTEEQRAKVIVEAGKNYLGVAVEAVPNVRTAIMRNGQVVVESVKGATAEKYGKNIDPSFNLIDRKGVEAAATRQAHFARDKFGQRSVALSTQARAIVSSGMERGLDRFAIAQEIEESIGDTGKTNAYWQVVASAFIGRSRTISMLSSFDEIGISKFQFESVLDEVTSDVCRFLHGKTFSVSSAIQRFAEVDDSDNPEAVKDLQPWAYTAKHPEGGEAIYYKSKGERHTVARIDASASGQKDKTGSFSSGLSGEAIERAGLSSPPLHGHCRSLIVPLESEVVASPAPRNPQVTPATLPAAPRRPRRPRQEPVRPAATLPEDELVMFPGDKPTPGEPIPPRGAQAEPRATQPEPIAPPAPKPASTTPAVVQSTPLAPPAPKPEPKPKPAKPASSGKPDDDLVRFPGSTPARGEPIPPGPRAETGDEIDARVSAKLRARIRELPPARRYAGATGTGYGYVDHGLPSIPTTPNGLRLVRYDVHPATLRAATRRERTLVRVADLTMQFPDIPSHMLERAIDATETRLVVVKYGGKLYVHQHGEEAVLAHLFGSDVAPAFVIDLDARKQESLAADARRRIRGERAAERARREAERRPVPIVPAMIPAQPKPAATSTAGTVKPTTPGKYAPAPPVQRTSKYDVDDLKRRGIQVRQYIQGSDINRGASEVFAGEFPTIEAFENMWADASKSGHAVKVKAITCFSDGPGKTAMSVTGEIQTSEGRSIGRFTRTFTRHPKVGRSPQRFEVHHDLYVIDDKDESSKSSGATMLRRAIQSYEQMGVTDITVDAHWIGRHAWATYGFDWSYPGQRETMRDNFAAFLRHNGGYDRKKAATIAEAASVHPWTLANTDIDGKTTTVFVNAYHSKGDQTLPLGKAFMLGEVSNWEGVFKLGDKTSPSYKRARERIGL